MSYIVKELRGREEGGEIRAFASVDQSMRENPSPPGEIRLPPPIRCAVQGS